MNLEEAIKHAEEVAEEQLALCEMGLCTSAQHEKDVRECGLEHRQLAEWLRALKEIWDSGDCNDCRNGQCEWKPKLGQLVRFNCPHYVGVVDGGRR